MNTRYSRIHHLLTSLQLESFEIIDESSAHANHYQGHPEGFTHIKLVLKGPIFEGKSPIQQHKIIHNLLKAEFQNGLHALSINILPLIDKSK